MNESNIVGVSNRSLDLASSNSAGDNSYGFVVTVRPCGRVVSLDLPDICEPNGSRTQLTSLSCKDLYKAINKRLDGLEATPTTYILSDQSRFLLNDDELQEVLAFESQYEHENLFRFFLDPIPGTSINQPTAFDVPINDSTAEIITGNSSHVAKDQKSPIVPDPTATHNVSCPIPENIPAINLQLKEFSSPVDPTDKFLKRSLQRLSPDKQSAKNGINVDPTSYKKSHSLDRDSTPSDSNFLIDGSDGSDEEEINDGDIVDFISEPQNYMFRHFL